MASQSLLWRIRLRSQRAGGMIGSIDAWGLALCLLCLPPPGRMWCVGFAVSNGWLVAVLHVRFQPNTHTARLLESSSASLDDSSLVPALSRGDAD